MSQTNLWETKDGQLWLAKALDPAGWAVELKGLPDQESHNVVVLNYQSQYSVDPPNLFNAPANDGATFESEMYFFQHPYLFGVSASYPTGTVDPLHDNGNVNVVFGNSTTAPYVKFNSSGHMFPRTCKQFVNSQVNGATSVKQARDAFAKYCQKHRVIYGAAQLVPTCSAQDNSGSIAVSQQPFVGDDAGYRIIDAGGDYLNRDSTYVGDPIVLNKYGLKCYRPNDFPSSEDNIRNPASLLTRFYEGAYIPYKLRNPFNEDFLVSDTYVDSSAPYWVVGASYHAYGSSEGSWLPLTWDDATHSFTTPITNADGAEREKVLCSRISLELMTKTGQLVSIVFCNLKVSSAEERARCHFLTFNAYLSMVMSDVQPVNRPDVFVSVTNSTAAAKATTYYMDGSTRTEVANGAGIYRVNETGGAICPFPSDNIVSVLCKAMNMRGNITLLIRMGVEMQVTGSSSYSPFNHKSPEYDEAALKSYLRVIHRASDAYYGNAASEYFRQNYYQWYMNMLYNPPREVDFANRGSYWRGAVRA